MTLDEAIKHAEEVAREQEEDANKWEYTLRVYRRKDYCEPSTIPKCEKELKRCKECASEHHQLADWLKLLRRILDSGDCNSCASFHSQCRYAPRLGEQIRYNCPFYSNEKEGEQDETD